MKTNTNSAAELVEGVKLLRQGIEVLQRGPLEHYLAELTLAHELLLNSRHAPFKVGGVVKVCAEIDFKARPGWDGLQDELKLGTHHVVREVGVSTVLNDLALLVSVRHFGGAKTTVWLPAKFVESVKLGMHCGNE